MTSGVVGMRSQMPSVRGHTFDFNGTTGDTNMAFNFEDMKKHAVQLLEQLDALSAEDIVDHKSSHKLIAKVCHILKSSGSRLDDDSAFRQQLDLYFDLLRNILRKPKLSSFGRTMILEVIELRAGNWVSNEDIEEYYRRKMAEFEANDSYLSTDFDSEQQKSHSFVSNAVRTDLSKSSTKLNKPTKVTAKTFLRDEVLIRNGDSGKVMGIKGRRVHLIEEMSDTVISFQKVTAGAKERLVQITGSSEESIERAKELIENTIKRNASPDPFESQNRSFDSNFNQNPIEVNKTMEPVVRESTPIQKSDPTVMATTEPIVSHSFTVEVNSDVILLSTTNYDLGLRAQQLLKESLLSDKTLKQESVQQKLHNCERRLSNSDSTSSDELKKKAVTATDPKKEVMAALDSATKSVEQKHKLNPIQRSLSQGTVPSQAPIGRTSLRFMSKSESVSHDPNPKLSYERKFLMECSELPLSKSIPNIEVMAKIYTKTPEIIRKHHNSGKNSNTSDTSVPLHKSQSFSQSRAITVDNWI